MRRSHAVAFPESGASESGDVVAVEVPAKEGGSGTQQLLVSTRQRGNPVLQLIKSVSWQFAKVQPDFILGDNACGLFLSLRYHLLHPDYLYSRIAEVKRDFRLRLVLCIIDVQNSSQPLILLTSLASANGFTVVMCWSQAECARYLETYKALENKSSASIQEKLESDYLPRLEDTLTAIRSINRTDAKVLSRNFGSLKSIISASMEELALCNGIGDRKVRQLHSVFNDPFLEPE
eukprot:CAMPEP_0184524284 /NCGR_PEP_ID=MMETSP0198_2-20121128/9416_1 /TAXON_ID=1112570 /ORGANISM="Thraustochytrium sp., Strain LLF1b" /LENGTH=233 /DNA_ID=CAMNT_0026915533 /DNA_START=247 /DNA_END=948 /DNA_ORIENTATION=-